MINEGTKMQTLICSLPIFIINGELQSRVINCNFSQPISDVLMFLSCVSVRNFSSTGYVFRGWIKSKQSYFYEKKKTGIVNSPVLIKN